MQSGLNPNSTAGVRSSGQALSTPFRTAQSRVSAGILRAFEWLENQLHLERDQLPLWIPVGVGAGIAAWFLFANASFWIAFIATGLGVAVLAGTAGRHLRVARALFWFALMAAVGCALIWFRSWSVSAPVLERPVVSTFHAQIVATEHVSSRSIVRLTLKTRAEDGIPERVRVNIPDDRTSDALKPGAIIKLRARLMPPAMAALPGAYDFSRRAWFSGLGATGQALGPVTVVAPANSRFELTDIRKELSSHVRSQMAGGAGAIAATLATGDRGAISEGDAEAMRRSGLAHLLSISGLHVTAVVGAAYLFTLKLLALFPALAIRWRLPLVAAGAAAVAALGYTLMTGAQVPTIRACVAALLVLAALIMGRSAITLRMVAAGALFVLIFWPESLVGPSFQLSFAAVTAIIALHEHPAMKSLLARREEHLLRRIGRIILSLFLTGLVVEIALMPIALYHFHKAGLYGAFANIIAIPLTTFVIMPLEALALLFDSFGMGAPFWWLCEKMLNGLLGLAHFVSTRPGAVTMLPTMATGAFALVLGGGLWLLLWKEKWRLWGLVPVALGSIWMVSTPAPDIYITGDGRHVGIRSSDGDLAMLRTRSGDFIRGIITENAGIDAEPVALEDRPDASCNRDSCSVELVSDERKWSLLATRSSHYIPALALAAACRRADIVVSERRLPKSCEPRWLKVDRSLLAQTGGMTIDLSNQRVVTVLGRSGYQPWTRLQRAARTESNQ